MKALISPLQNNLICQVEPDDDAFPVAEPLYWQPCPDDCTTEWTYVNGQFLPPQPYVPSASDNKQTAMNLLQKTDWTSIMDVGDPALSNPYLSNQAEFIAWRSQVRAIAVNPIEGFLPIFDEMPLENWQNA